MTVRLLDLSHHQARALGGGRYLVTANLQLAKEAGASGVVVRSNYGLSVDSTAAEHNQRADAAGLPRAFYWYNLSRKDPVMQATTAYIQSGQRPGVRGFIDLEESQHNDGADPMFTRYSDLYWLHVNRGLVACDNLTGLLTGIYSSRTWLDHWFTADQQARWNNRLLWVAHYPNLPPGAAVPPGIPWVPAGWKGLARPWAVWQDRIGAWPGFDGQVDQNVVWPGLELSVIFGAGVPPVITPPPPATFTPAQLQTITDVARGLREAAGKLAGMGE